MLHCQIHPKFTLSFIWAPPPTFSLSATNAKLCGHLQLPPSLCLTLPPTSVVPQGPPAPSLLSQALGVTSALWPGLWFVHFLELQLHRAVRGQGLPAPKAQRLHSCSPGRTSTGSAGFQPQDSREEAAEAPGLEAGCSAQGILCYSPAPGKAISYVSAIKTDKVTK